MPPPFSITVLPYTSCTYKSSMTILCDSPNLSNSTHSPSKPAFGASPLLEISRSRITRFSEFNIWTAAVSTPFPLICGFSSPPYLPNTTGLFSSPQQESKSFSVNTAPDFNKMLSPPFRVKDWSFAKDLKGVRTEVPLLASSPFTESK